RGPPTCAAAVAPPATTQTVIPSAVPAPDDHFAASPDCRVMVPATRRVDGAGGCPTIGAGSISPAGVQQAAVGSAPDDHFTASPHRRLNKSSSKRSGDARRSPPVIDARRRLRAGYAAGAKVAGKHS